MTLSTVLAGVMMTVGVAMALLAHTRDPAPGTLWIPIACVVFGVYALWAWHLWLPRRARRVFAQQRDLQLSMTIDLDDDGVRIAQGDLNHSMTPWPDVHRWRKSPGEPGLYLIYRSELIFHMIPARWLTPDLAAQLGRWLTERVGPAK